MNRVEALKALVEAELPIAQGIARMSQFAWDSEEYLAVLTPENLGRVLTLFSEGSITELDVEDWANALECRDDLALSEPAVSKVLYELANPLLTHALSAERAHHLLCVVKSLG
ncbi:hypothetical protein [Methylophilus sp. OH31]|uniref:hypothetical protein n=1 Tax=Methylophilus sp. OH31 TaxID=1387312 RepID=UPI0004651D97|nr:hypothetical protein [Methylophilus sp. OH31]